MSKQRVNGWSLVEMTVVMAIVALLAGIMLPSLVSARERARLVACAVMMREIHVALMGYAATNRRYFPPFAFSNWSGDLPQSGHWGGASQVGGPDELGRKGVQYVNLWVLVLDGAISPAGLICPGAPAEVRNGRASYFARTSRFSTYCLRMPPSEDLFRAAPSLAYYRGGSLMGIYSIAAGGQNMSIGKYRGQVPLVNMSRPYRIAEHIACGDGEYDASTDALLSDSFWRDNHVAAAGDDSQACAVRFSRCHGRRFNVLYGGGAVRTVSDDGTVAANSIPPGGAMDDDGDNFATYAERIWQFFDAER